MRRLAFLFLLPLAVLAGCSEQSPTDAPDQPHTGPQLSTTTGPIFYVSPTGTNDTENIQNALDACVSAGPGCTVQLTEGTFRSAMVEVTGFDGFFVGSGQGATVVTSLPRLACREQVHKNSWPSLLKFREGNPRISDLTFEVTELEPCDGWRFHGRGLTNRWLGSLLMISGKPIDRSFDCANPSRDMANSSVDRVQFIGSAGTHPVGRNVHELLTIGGDNTMVRADCLDRLKPLGGTHTVRNSSFRRGIIGVQWSVDGGSLTIGGSPSASNTVDDMFVGLSSLDASNADVEITHNDVKNVIFFGVRVTGGWQYLVGGYPLPAVSRYAISHNSVHAINSSDGIAFIDHGPPSGAGKTTDAVVSHNTITLDTEWGGIWGYGAQGILVENNRISGTGVAGIYMGWHPFGPTDSGWTLVGNNVEYVTAWIAPIFLGQGSSMTTVVGGDNVTNVLDLGTDNTLVGVNNMNGNPPGPDLHEAMQRKRELLKSMR